MLDGLGCDEGNFIDRVAIAITPENKVCISRLHLDFLLEVLGENITKFFGGDYNFSGGGGFRDHFIFVFVGCRSYAIHLE